MRIEQRGYKDWTPPKRVHCPWCHAILTEITTDDVVVFSYEAGDQRETYTDTEYQLGIICLDCGIQIIFSDVDQIIVNLFAQGRLSVARSYNGFVKCNIRS